MNRRRVARCAASGALLGAALYAGAHLPAGPATAAVGPATGMAVDVPALTEPITAANARGLPRCITEDYTASPCYWDAAHRGNRIGMSFYVGTDRCRHYFAAADEARYGDKTSPCADPS